MISKINVKHPTSGEHACDQEATVQRALNFERSSFFYLSTVIVRTQCNAY